MPDKVIVEAFDKHWTMKDLKDLRYYLEMYLDTYQPDGDDYFQWESMYLAIDKTIKREEVFNANRS